MSRQENRKRTYVLVAGAFHGAWCWYKVIPLLEKAGQTVIALDLPATGKDQSPVTDASLEGWANFVCQILDQQREPVVLVGHSRGGAVISQAAEYCPEKVEILVFVAGALLYPGDSIISNRAQGVSPVHSNVILSDDLQTAQMRQELIREQFYEDCSDEDVCLARLLLRPEPIGPLQTPVALTVERFGRLPKIYIATTKDKGLLPEVQERMYTATPCQRLIRMDTGHSPFFAAPEELARHLLSV